MSIGPSLTDMPDVVMIQIMGELNLRAILILRKVCHSLRNFIDSKKSVPQLLDINSYVKKDQIEVWYYSGTCLEVVKYQKSGENGCKIENEHKEKKLEGSYVEIFLQDLEFFINRQVEPLRQFQLKRQEFIGAESNIFSQIYRKLNDILRPRPLLLKIEEVHLSVANHHEILAVLPYLEPKILKNISIFSIFQGLFGSTYRELEMRQIVKLEQWKKAKSLLIEHFFMDIKIKKLMHFSFVKAGVVEIYAKDLDELKECFLQSSTPKEFILTYANLYNQDQLFNSLPEPVISSDIFGRTDKNWSISVPEQDKELNITHFVEQRKFKFTNIKPLANGIVFN